MVFNRIIKMLFCKLKFCKLDFRKGNIMSECVREMTSKELIEQSSLSNKELILQRLKSENDKVNSIIGNLEKTVTEQRNLIESYRTVLKDMVYSNWLK